MNNKHKELIEKGTKFIEDNKGQMKNLQLRQRWHFMSEAGSIGSANTFVFYKDKYHMFYQCNPYGNDLENTCWGHAVSDDLIDWQYLPLAIVPSEVYDNGNEISCLPGSVIVHDNKLYLFYTSVVKENDKLVHQQSLAISEDGIVFEKYDHNPITLNTPDYFDASNFRDPKVWKNQYHFYMLVGTSKDNKGQALLYRSNNLLYWDFINVAAESKGEFGSSWECPDMFPMKDKYVLMFSTKGLKERKTIYLVGNMDYSTGKFIYSSFGELDWGFDYYAPRTFLDDKGRRLIVGSTSNFNSEAATKPDENSYTGALSMFREIEMKSDNVLKFYPIKKYKELRKNRISNSDVKINQLPYLIEAADGISFELRLIIDLVETTTHSFDIVLRSSKDETKKTVVTFDIRRSEMYIDRSYSDGISKGIIKTPINLFERKEIYIHLFVDKSSIEIYTDGYRTVHSCNIFASDEQNKNFIKVNDGELFIEKIKSYGIEKARK